MCASACKHKRHLMALLKYELFWTMNYFLLKKSSIKTLYNSISNVKMHDVFMYDSFSYAELIQMTVWRSSSSTVSNSHPERAIDGNKDPCVTITSHSQDNSAWTVQLSGVYQVSCVSIYSKDQTGTSMTGAPVQIHIRSYNNSIDKKM